MKRWLPWVLLAVVVAGAIAIGGRGSSCSTPGCVAASIESEVRCPQCEGQSVAASNAAAARALRVQIEKDVAAGASKAQIEQSLEDTYGSDIILRPASSGVQGLVWAIPVIVLVTAAGGLALAFRRWQTWP